MYSRRSWGLLGLETWDWELGTCDFPASSPGGSDPHRHDHVGVVVPFRADGLHHRLTDLVLQIERHDVGRHRREKIEDVLRVEADRETRAGVVDRNRLTR